jgi:hypothetical protein
MLMYTLTGYPSLYKQNRNHNLACPLSIDDQLGFVSFSYLVPFNQYSLSPFQSK